MHQKGFPFKVLLVLDKVPGHPAQLGDFYPNVKVVYLPPNITALLQPLDQEVIASFKAYYLRRTIAMALQATETKKDLTLKDFWKSYNILDAVKNIAHFWKEVMVTNMNGVWRKLCPQFVNDFHGFEERVDHVITNVVALSKEIDLYVEVDDVTELLKSHREELSAGDLIQLEKQILKEEEETPVPEPKAFTRQGLSKGFAEIQQALATFEAQVPNMERFTWVSRGIMDLLQCYKEISDKKRILSVQSNLEQYLRKWRDLHSLHQLPILLQSLYRLPQLPLLFQLLHHLVNIYLNSCGMELFSPFLTKYFFTLFVTFYSCAILYSTIPVE